jgi:hypothetical protein
MKNELRAGPSQAIIPDAAWKRPVVVFQPVDSAKTHPDLATPGG